MNITSITSSQREISKRPYARDKGPVICEEIRSICSEAHPTGGYYLV